MVSIVIVAVGAPVVNRILLPAVASIVVVVLPKVTAAAPVPNIKLLVPEVIWDDVAVIVLTPVKGPTMELP